MFSFPKRQLMPYINGPGCTIPGTCPQPAFPISTADCVCTPAAGGINELYFIPCTQTFSQTNITDVAWWQAMITANTLGRSGMGLGSVGKKASKTERVGSCRTEQITQLTWALRFIIKCFDKSSSRFTCQKLNELLTGFSKYLLVARMCDGDNTVLPIGRFDTSDLVWTVPDNFEDIQSVEIELSWIEFALPCTVDVAGLSAILPKLS